MKTGIIIQARMESTRYPGKVLKSLPIDTEISWPVLYWVIQQCRRVASASVIVATSTNRADDAIVDYLDKEMHYIPVYRGHPTDVLDRMFRCAGLYHLDEIVRVTGDCPFICPEVIEQVIELRRQQLTDYASNVDPPSFPDGLDVQCVSFGALLRAHQEATAETDRDTVLQYIVHNRSKFSVANLTCPIGDLSSMRWVLDTEGDRRELSEIARINGLAPGNLTLPRLLRAVDRLADMPKGPDLRNSRYHTQRTRELKGTTFTESMIVNASARQIQPYGASTYSKSFVAWGDGGPLHLTHAQGSRVWDVDGNELIDMTAGLGTTLLGHADPGVKAIIGRQLDLGIAFPLSHVGEAAIAQKIVNRVMNGATDSYELVPSPWKLVFGKNGSDVTTAAVRLARVTSGRGGVGVIDNGYHGWHDWALDHTGRGNGCFADSVYRNTFDMITAAILDNLLACVIVEPDKLSRHELEEIIFRSKLTNTLVIFDEMVTFGHYRSLTFASSFDLSPDLICFGKALGNGMPVTALIGKREIMNNFVTLEGEKPYAFFSGTHFGEMCSIAAAYAVCSRFTIDALNDLCVKQEQLSLALGGLAFNDIATMGGDQIPRINFKNPEHAHQFRREMAYRGVLVYTLLMPTLAHSEEDIMHVVGSAEESLWAIRNGKARGASAPGSRIMRS